MPDEVFKLGTGELATWLGVTPRWVNELVRKGDLPRPLSGGFNAKAAVQAYCKFLRDRSVGNNSGTGDGDHKMRLIKARADLAEMEAAQLAGQLIRSELAETVWSEASARVRQRMLSVAPKAAPVVAVETSAEVCHEAIEAFVHEALAELAGTSLQGAGLASEGDEGSIQDLSPAAEADDIGMGGSEQALVE
jgi:hypothetical protein